MDNACESREMDVEICQCTAPCRLTRFYLYPCHLQQRQRPRRRTATGLSHAVLPGSLSISQCDQNKGDAIIVNCNPTLATATDEYNGMTFHSAHANRKEHKLLTESGDQHHERAENSIDRNCMAHGLYMMSSKISSTSMFFQSMPLLSNHLPTTDSTPMEPFSYAGRANIHKMSVKQTDSHKLRGNSQDRMACNNIVYLSPPFDQLFPETPHRTKRQLNPRVGAHELCRFTSQENP